MIAIVLTPTGTRVSAGADAPTTRPAPGIVLESPADYQIFQRQTRTQGTLIIRGHLDGLRGPLEIHIAGTPAEGELPTAWQPVPVDAKTETFDAKIPVPAGGWYRLEARVPADSAQGAAAAATTSVDHVGVGEVFVIAGQSNSTNYGQTPQKTRTKLVSSFDGNTWAVADDPQPGVQDRSKNGSFIPAFGDALADHDHVPVGVACVGCGSTSVREWLPQGERMKQQPTTGRHVRPAGPGEWESTGQLFDGMMRRIQALGPRGFRAVLWHQGESDAGQARGGGTTPDRQITGDQYRAWLKLIIRASNDRAGWTFPWFVAQATYHSPKDPADPEFRAAQKSLWDDGSAQPGPDTDALGADLRHGVHFNEDGLQAHGKLWAQKVIAYLDRTLKADAAPTTRP